MKILGRILFQENRPNIYLIINSSLYVSSRDKALAKSVIDELDRKNRLIVLPDRFSHLPYTRKVFHFFSLFFSNSAFHCLLRADVIAYARSFLKRNTTLELTSPDIATRVAKFIPAYLIRRIPQFICVSQSVAQKFQFELRARGIEVTNSNIHVWSIPYFDQKGCQSFEKKKILVSACRFIKRKNVPLLAKAISNVINLLPEWDFYLFGQGDQEEEIKEILRESIESGRVRVCYSENTLTTLASSSIYVSLIEPDNYPSQSVLEAMASENALLLSRTGSSSNFISADNPNGLLVELAEKSISDAILRLCQSDDLLAEMQKNSAKYVSTKYNPDAFISEFLSCNGANVRSSKG